MLSVNSVISGWCYKWTILQRNYAKMTISWFISFLHSMVKKMGVAHNMNMLYLNQCYD